MTCQAIWASINMRIDNVCSVLIGCYTLTKIMLNQSGESILEGLQWKGPVDWTRKVKHVLIWLSWQCGFLQTNKETTGASVQWFFLKNHLTSLSLCVSTFFGRVKQPEWPVFPNTMVHLMVLEETFQWFCCMMAEVQNTWLHWVIPTDYQIRI